MNSSRLFANRKLACSSKKESLYNNNITSLQEYIQLVEEWILFYNTTRLKSKIKKNRKTYTKREK